MSCLKKCWNWFKTYLSSLKRPVQLTPNMLEIVIIFGCIVTNAFIRLAIFQVLYEAPYAILYHHGLELLENGPNELSNDQFCASLPIHTTTDQLNHTGIEITKRQTAFRRCLCGNGYKLENLDEIHSNRKSLHNLSEAMRIDSSFTGDITLGIIILLQCCSVFLYHVPSVSNYNFTSMFFFN